MTIQAETCPGSCIATHQVWPLSKITTFKVHKSLLRVIILYIYSMVYWNFRAICTSGWRSCTIITQFGQRHALPFKPCLSFNLVDPNASGMASFSMPLAHWAKCKWQATEGPEYEIKTQEAIDGLHSGGFKSIRPAATALSRKCV